VRALPEEASPCFATRNKEKRLFFLNSERGRDLAKENHRHLFCLRKVSFPLNPQKRGKDPLSLRKTKGLASKERRERKGKEKEEKKAEESVAILFSLSVHSRRLAPSRMAAQNEGLRAELASRMGEAASDVVATARAVSKSTAVPVRGGALPTVAPSLTRSSPAPKTTRSALRGEGEEGEEEAGEGGSLPFPPNVCVVPQSVATPALRASGADLRQSARLFAQQGDPAIASTRAAVERMRVLSAELAAPVGELERALASVTELASSLGEKRPLGAEPDIERE
jgi:hypothetical protein